MEPARTPQQVFTVVEGGSPGHLMRHARERMGLSIDDVCGHLKMMPAQIRSMESDSLEGLPPGGYARAFIKGYARFLGLDADQVVQSLVSLNSERKDVAELPPLKVSPVVAAQRQADAEADSPDLRHRREPVSVEHNFGQLIREPAADSRLVKYSLAALVIGLLVYLLVPGSNSGGKSELSVTPVPPDAPVNPPPVMAERIPDGQPGAMSASGAAAAFPPGTVMVPAQPTERPPLTTPSGSVNASVNTLGSVQNSAVSGASSPAYGSTPGDVSGTAPVGAPVRSTVNEPAAVKSAAPAAIAAPSAQNASVAIAAPAAPAAPTATRTPPTSSSPAAMQAPAVASAPVRVTGPAGSAQRIRLVFSDRAYVTIRDRDGHVLLAQLNPGGTEKTVEGNPPFRVIIGNSRAVQMDYRGKPYDLSIHTKDDIARFVME